MGNVHEKLRKKLAPLRFMLALCYISFGLFAVSVLLMIFKIPSFWIAFVIFIGSPIVATVIGMKYGYMWADFTPIVKQYGMENIFEKVFKHVRYFPKDYNPSCNNDGKPLVEGWGNARGSDLIIGEYKGITFEFSDLDLYHVAGNGQEMSVFKGQWLTCEFKIPLETPLILRERKWKHRSFLGSRRAKKLQREKHRSERDKKISINTDSTEFNKKYFVLSENEHMAFYVLTPHFMEFLIHMNEIVDADSSVCFVGTKAHFAFNTNKDLFELNPYHVFSKSILDTFIEQCDQQAQCIAAVIDELLINEYLFGKGN